MTHSMKTRRHSELQRSPRSRSDRHGGDPLAENTLQDPLTRGETGPIGSPPPRAGRKGQAQSVDEPRDEALRERREGRDDEQDAREEAGRESKDGGKADAVSGAETPGGGGAPSGQPAPGSPAGKAQPDAPSESGGGGSASGGPGGAAANAPGPAGGGAPAASGGGGGGGGGGAAAPALGGVAGAAAAPAAPAALEGDTPSAVADAYVSMTPSQQVTARHDLGGKLSDAATSASEDVLESVPEIQATQEGTSEAEEAEDIETPEGQTEIKQDQSKAEVEVEEAPPEATVRVPQVNTPTEATKSPQSIDAAIQQASGSEPEIDTHLEKPEVPLEGEADPNQIGTAHDTAHADASEALIVAQAAAGATSPDIFQPRELDETVPVPELPAPEISAEQAAVEGMDQFEAWNLNPKDQAAFDAQVGDGMSASLSTAKSQMEQGEQQLSDDSDTLLQDAQTQADEHTRKAQTDQQQHVEKARTDMQSEQERVRGEQQKEVDRVITDLDKERETQADSISDRVDKDTRQVDRAYSEAEQKAKAKVEKGRKDSKKATDDAKKDSESESWWDKAFDFIKKAVKALTDLVAGIWKAVTAAVKFILDGVVALAGRLIKALVSFVAMVLREYAKLAKALVQGLLGEIFPELADALCDFIDDVEAGLEEVLNKVADTLISVLQSVADFIVKGMEVLLSVFEGLVAGFQMLLDAIQNGEWADVGKLLLTALLKAAGINPAEFFAMFGQIDQIIDAVVADPGAIAKNAGKAIGQGFTQFGENFLDHFISGALEWITGSVGVTLPDKLDIAGIFDVACQILGLTYAHLREKAVEHLGEGAVTAVEKLYGAVKALVEGGWDGLWEYVKDGLSNLAQDVVMKIGTWLMEKAVLTVGRWITGLVATLGLSSILEALIAAWNFIEWVVDNLKKIYAVVQSTVDSIHQFVQGNISPAANRIESALAGLISPAIDLAAELLGIGDLPDKVKEIVGEVRAVIDGAIDKVFIKFKDMLGLNNEKPEGDEFDGQIGETVEFSAAGEGHKLWVDAGGEVMVASTPMSVADRLADWRGRLNKEPSSKDGEGGPKNPKIAAGLLSVAEQYHNKTSDRAAAAIHAENSDKATYDETIEKDERTLAGAIEKLFGQFQDEMELVGNFNFGRSQFSFDPKVKEKLTEKYKSLFLEAGVAPGQYKKAGLDIRHRVSFADTFDTLQSSVRMLPLDEASDLIAQSGRKYRPRERTRESVLDAAYRRLNDAFNDPSNLFVGPLGPNRSRGRGYDHGDDPDHSPTDRRYVKQRAKYIKAHGVKGRSFILSTNRTERMRVADNKEDSEAWSDSGST